MNYEDIKKLITDMGNSKIDTLDIEFPDGIKISMKKNQTAVKEVMTQLPVEHNITVNTNSSNEANSKEDWEDYKIMKSPMVGTFYESSSPTDKPFVKVGDKVKKGQVLCVVEAMKLMNEIESEFDGEIVEICKKNEEMVEYGSELFKIR